MSELANTKVEIMILRTESALVHEKIQAGRIRLKMRRLFLCCSITESCDHLFGSRVSSEYYTKQINKHIRFGG